MHRKLWTLVTLLSLLLCAATLALWARSYWVYDSIEWTSHYRTRFIACDSGRVLVQVNHGPSGTHEFEPIDFVAYVKKANEGDGMGPAVALWRLLGSEFGLCSERVSPRPGFLHRHHRASLRGRHRDVGFSGLGDPSCDSPAKAVNLWTLPRLRL
jgi:hypothetical protein